MLRVGMLESVNFQSFLGVEGKVSALRWQWAVVLGVSRCTYQIVYMNSILRTAESRVLMVVQDSISSYLQLRELIPNDLKWFDVVRIWLPIALAKHSEHTRFIKNWAEGHPHVSKGWWDSHRTRSRSSSSYEGHGINWNNLVCPCSTDHAKLNQFGL